MAYAAEAIVFNKKNKNISTIPFYGNTKTKLLCL